MILDLFCAGPARVKALLVGAVALASVVLALLAYGLWWRAEAFQARAERDHAIDQLAVVSAAAQACSAAVDHAKAVGDAAVKATGELVAAARRLSKPAEKTIERIETILERPAPPGAGCSEAWDEIETEHRKAGGLR